MFKEDSKKTEKTLVIGYDRDAEIMDTIKTAWYSDALIYIHDRLVTRDYEFGYKPGLAERWDVSDDGLVWTFHLRKDVKFHDDKEFKPRTLSGLLIPLKTRTPVHPSAEIWKLSKKSILLMNIL